MDGPMRIDARNVSRVLPGPVPVTLVRDITVAFPASQFAVITGPSGSGKSSLLYLLGLLDAPTSGEVWIDGRPTAALGRDALADLRLQKLGFVFQFHFLLPEFTVLANVLIPMKRRGGQSAEQMRARAVDLLTQFGLAAHIDKHPDQLSGGERQRVALARALANDPPIVLADEPTGNLDTKNARLVFDIFKRLATEQGRTVIAVTHDAELARLADRQIRLRDGRLESA
jgi:lipoprotein-releasing system ATP-binding protein